IQARREIACGCMVLSPWISMDVFSLAHGVMDEQCVSPWRQGSLCGAHTPIAMVDTPLACRPCRGRRGLRSAAVRRRLRICSPFIALDKFICGTPGGVPLCESNVGKAKSFVQYKIGL